jgi:hypothetical protein
MLEQWIPPPSPWGINDIQNLEGKVMIVTGELVVGPQTALFISPDALPRWQLWHRERNDPCSSYP